MVRKKSSGGTELDGRAKVFAGGGREDHEGLKCSLDRWGDEAATLRRRGGHGGSVLHEDVVLSDGKGGRDNWMELRYDGVGRREGLLAVLQEVAALIEVVPEDVLVA